MTITTTILNPCIAHAAIATACGQSLRSHGQNLYWANRKQSKFDKNNLFLHSSRTRRLDAIRITRQRTFLFSCRGSSTFGDEYLSAVSSYPLRGWKQILAIYLIPPEIMSQQAQGGQSFNGMGCGWGRGCRRGRQRDHRQHEKINK